MATKRTTKKKTNYPNCIYRTEDGCTYDTLVDLWDSWRNVNDTVVKVRRYWVEDEVTLTATNKPFIATDSCGDEVEDSE